MAHNLIWHGSRLFYKLWRALPTSVIIRASLRGNSKIQIFLEANTQVIEMELERAKQLLTTCSLGCSAPAEAACTAFIPRIRLQPMGIKASTSSTDVHTAWFHNYLTESAEHWSAGSCPTRGWMGKGSRSPQGGVSTAPLCPVLVGLLPGYNMLLQELACR